MAIRKRATSKKRDLNGSAGRKAPRPPVVETIVVAPEGRSKYSTISHTLPLDLVDHLRAFAHYQRVSASSVMEFALRNLFSRRDDSRLGAAMRREGAGPRRKRS